MDDVPQLLVSGYRRAYDILYNTLLFGAEEIPSVEAWMLHDDLDAEEYGGSWLTDERNIEYLRGTQDALLRQIEQRADLRRAFLRDDDGHGQDGTQMRLCRQAIAVYECEVQDFLKSMVPLLHVSPAPPLRAPELLSTTTANSGVRRRSTLIWEKMLMIYVQYHKSLELTGHEADNIRFVPSRIADLLVTYLAIVENVETRVAVYGVDQAWDARFYTIFMEYLPFPDLSAICTMPSRMFSGTEEDAARVLQDSSSALAYLAKRKIMHNDIKPGNILYDKSRGAVLIDFGMVSIDGYSRPAGGTPHYMPPESAERARVLKSDVFALGVTMLYLLKKTPLLEMTARAWDVADMGCTQALNWQIHVRKLKDRLSAHGVEAIVSSMLEPDIRDRISADALAMTKFDSFIHL